MSVKKNNQAEDGFDLIDYPCDFAFKAMCRAADDIDLIDHLSQQLQSIVDKNDLLSARSSSSRTGKFESITLQIKVRDRDHLEAIYRVIAASPVVVMTL